MRVIAYSVVHYGKEYLRWSVRAVGRVASEVHIHYSDAPSCGHTTAIPNPDTREELFAAAQLGAEEVGVPCRWFDSPSRTFGEHGTFAEKTALERGADLVVNVDADELFVPSALSAALVRIAAAPPVARYHRVPFIHFWRSFRWACTDGMTPQRVIDPRVSENTHAYCDLAEPVRHFGYAQSLATMRYKMAVSLHRREFTRHRDWLREVFEPWAPGQDDVHPACDGIWNPRPCDDLALADLLGDHPYFDLERIA